MGINLELQWAVEILTFCHFVNSDRLQIREADIEETIRSFNISNLSLKPIRIFKGSYPVMSIIMDINSISILECNSIVQMESTLVHKRNRSEAVNPVSVTLSH